MLSAIVIAPHDLAMATIAAMSKTCNRGLLGVSIQMPFVFDCTAARTFSGSLILTNENSIPSCEKTFVKMRCVPP